MNELKPCPFCKTKGGNGHTWDCFFALKQDFSDSGDVSLLEKLNKAWQVRPIEDDLINSLKRIRKLYDEGDMVAFASSVAEEMADIASEAIKANK